MNSNFKRSCVQIAFLFFVLGCSTKQDKTEMENGAKRAASKPAEWTIMIFMNGDNNLEEFALANFDSIAKIGSTRQINIVVQFDRIPGHAKTNPDWTQTLRFKVEKGMKPTPKKAVQDIGEANMGDGKTLADFVSWAMTKYPAKHYMLDIWDHGQGYRLMMSSVNQRMINSKAQASFVNLSKEKSSGKDDFRSASKAPYKSCSNDETNNDELYNREIQDALLPIVKNGKIDLLGFDCCLMAMVETAYAYRDVAKVFVGSEDLIPGWGWKYDDWIGRLVSNPSMDETSLGKLLVNSYQGFYSKFDSATTLSCIDLTKSGMIANAISNASNDLSRVLPEQISIIRQCRNKCAVYAPDNSFYHIDALRFFSLVAQTTTDKNLRADASKVVDAISSSVLANYRGNLREGDFGSNGLAIYFAPSLSAYRDDGYSDNGYEKANKNYPVEFVQTQTWSDFLHKYWNLVKN